MAKKNTSSQKQPVDGKLAAGSTFNGAESGAMPLNRMIVGVGASAGGLEAFQELLGGLARDCGLTIVFVQHLAPDSESLLPGLLDRHSSMPVVLLAGKTVLESNTVYIAPPLGHLDFSNGVVQVTHDGDNKRFANAIDHFLHSLAEDQGSASIGIILSGAGSDGTMGLKAISDAGGLTFAQEPDSARFDSMPRNAEITGVADHVLSPTEIARELLSYVEHFRDSKTTTQRRHLQQQVDNAIPTIAEILLRVTDHNFQHYKTSTLGRRIQRRMHVLKLVNVDDYITLLSGSVEETQLLFRELLIGVTAFFRDPHVFESLSASVLPKLFENRGPDDQIRIWVPGCATGEEAYTIAMLCSEVMDNVIQTFHPEAAGSDNRNNRHSGKFGARNSGAPGPNIQLPSVQIFATDIDERALQIARTAAYPVGIQEDVSPERLQRFFIRRGKKFHIVKEIRDMVLFSTHNLISDPPFSRQDLISCRNLLIYLGSHLQKKLIPLFHYALRPSGFLLLGPSENISSHGDLFRTLDPKNRISQRKGTGVHATSVVQLADHGSATGSIIRPTQLPEDKNADLVKVMQRIVLDEFAPKSVIVDEDGQIRCASADMQKYLTVAGGSFQNNVIKMARSGLRVGLRAAMKEAIADRRQVTHDNLSVQVDGNKVQRIMLTVQPMPQVGVGDELFMIVFHDLGLPIDPGESATTRPGSLLAETNADTIIRQLERELASTGEDLERSIQDMVTANEELKSSNEELLSMNEELQSANEELEASKEEIQAGLDALEVNNQDLENLFRSTQIAIIFLDMSGNMVRFTPAATEIFRLIPTDLGRPLRDIVHTAVKMPPLPDQNKLLSDRQIVEHEVHLSNGKWFLRRVLPYIRGGNTDGMIITFVDITDQKQSAIRLATEHQIARLLADADSFEKVLPKILRSIRTTLDAEFCAFWVPDSAFEALTCADFSIRPGESRLKQLAREKRVRRFRVGEGLPGRVWKSLTAGYIADLSTDAGFQRSKALEFGLSSGLALPIVIGTSFFGVIELLTKESLEYDQRLLDMLQSIGIEIGQFVRACQLHDDFRDQESRKSAILESALDSIITMDVHGRIVDFNAAAEKTFGYRHQDIAGLSLAETIIPAEYRQAHVRGLQRFLESGDSQIIGKRIELSAQRADGTLFPVEVAIHATQTRNGEQFFTAYLRDITEHKQFIQTITDREEQFEALVDASSQIVWLTDADGVVIEDSPSWRAYTGQSPDEWKGTGWSNAIHEEDRAPTLRAWQAAVANRKSLEIEYRLMHHSGNWRWTQVRAVPLINDDGSVRGWVGMNTDIHERKQREETIVQRDRQLQIALTAGQMGSFEWDVPNHRVIWSPQVYRLFGLQESEFDGSDKMFFDLIHPADRRQVEQQIADEFAGDSDTLDVELRIVRHDDQRVIWINWRGQAFRDELGKPVRITGIVVEITKSKRQANSLAFAAQLQFEMAPLTGSNKIREIAARRIARFLELSHCLLIAIDDEASIAEVFHDQVADGFQSLVGLYQMNDFVTETERQDLRAGRAVVIDDTTDLARPPDMIANFSALRVGALVVSPCLDQGRLLFVLAALKPESNKWQEDEIELLSALAVQVYLRIERATAEEALKQSADAVRQSEAHLRRVIDNQLGLVGLIDRDGILLEVDNDSLRIAGLTRDDVIGKHFAECPWWTYDSSVSKKMRETMERSFAGEIVRYDVPLYAAGMGGTDQRLMIDFMMAPVFDDHGQVEFLIPSGVDISERKRVEAAQRENEQRLAMALKAGGLAAWEWNPDESHWTKEVYSLLGIRAEEKASLELFFRNVHPDDIDPLRSRWQAAIDREDVFREEFRVVHPDGKIRWINGAGQIERDENRRLTRIFGLIWDSTNDHLLAESLIESERRAQEANLAKSAFVANMSHEIRTPMTAVLGYADLLIAGENDPEKLHHLRTIKRNGDFLLDIINDILDLSKIEAGKMEVDTERFAPHKIVRDVRALMKVRADEKKIGFDVEFDGNIPSMIESDSKRLKQILVNLVGNAIKFTESGSVTLVVRLRVGDRSFLQFDVIDTGIGMTEQQLSRLFQPFSQGDASVSRAFGGTGLGLAISHRLATMLGGSLNVVSELGVGSTFSFMIDVGDISQSELISPRLESIHDSLDFLPEVQSLSCNVLVVDDRRDVRFLTKHFLTKAGATVLLAEDGLEAVEFVRNALAVATPHIDLILLDMQMPRMDGYQAATELRALGFDRPIIALTADAMHGDMNRCIECGCNAYLSKPIDGNALIRMVAQYSK